MKHVFVLCVDYELLAILNSARGNIKINTNDLMDSYREFSSANITLGLDSFDQDGSLDKLDNSLLGPA